MSSTAAADAVPPENPDHLPVNQDSDVMESNHDLPARTMADEEREEETHNEKDDPATMAASEELKHTSISDKVAATARVEPLSTEAEAEPEGEDKQMGERVSTPDAEPSDVQDEEMRERISSPKKKRGRDQDDDTRELEDGNPDEPGSSADGGGLNGNRTIRSGPEKKRPRDTSEELSKSAEKAAEAKV
jgi:hypothetical protein